MWIIHRGTNHHEEDLNLTKNLKKLETMIKEINEGNDIEISFCGIVYWEDRDCKDMIDDTNKKLRSYCTSIGIGFINNGNIDGSYFNGSKLHLNRNGPGLSARNIALYVKLKAGWYLQCRHCVFLDAENNASKNLNGLFKLKNIGV